MRIGGFAGKDVPDARRRAGRDAARTPSTARCRAGSLDTFEWVGPYDDEKFGDRKEGPKQVVSKVAPNYYYPGWWKGGMQLHLVVSKDKFEALPKPYQAALRAAARDRQRLDAGPIRRRQSRRVEAARRRRR